jgi:uncharacterized protein YkwD
VRRAFSVIQVMQLALCGSLFFLAGCPGANDFGTGTSVAGMVVEAAQGNSQECQTPANSDALIARMLELVNNERQSRGLHPLTLNPVLSGIADDYACEMINSGFFAHVAPSGEGPGQRAINAGYVFLAIGENLAGGQTSPEQAMVDWMNSTVGHRENILAQQWKEIGIAVRTGGQYGVYWVQEFGNPPATARTSP